MKYVEISRAIPDIIIYDITIKSLGAKIFNNSADINDKNHNKTRTERVIIGHLYSK